MNETERAALANHPPVPGEERVERAAKAVYYEDRGLDPFGKLLLWQDAPEEVQELYRKLARAALAAAGELDDLDALLAEVEPMKEITIEGREGERCFARLFPEHRREGERVGRYYLGSGTTRMAAIRDAVAKAEEVRGVVSEDEIARSHGMPEKWRFKEGGQYPHGYVVLFQDVTNHRKPDDHSDFVSGKGETMEAAIADACRKAKAKEVQGG